MLIIICIECFGMSYFLLKKWYNKRIFAVIFASNFVSGIFGFIASFLLNGGWWLVVWFPWVSRYEADGNDAVKALVIFYLIALVFTLIIETLFNLAAFKNEFKKAEIFKKTLFINLISYSVGSIALYSFSFS